MVPDSCLIQPFWFENDLQVAVGFAKKTGVLAEKPIAAHKIFTLRLEALQDAPSLSQLRR